jgi:tetratricopeptide (TPR) repeat protein
MSLNPNSADILTLYAAWASGFGEPEEGVAAAERAMRLNPEMPVWALGNYRYAYFMNGEYEKAIAMVDRRPAETRMRSDYVMRAGALAALGRDADARKATAEALARYPDLSVEAWAGLPEWSGAERHRLIETMSEAGFPLCASEVEEIASDRRLPECETERSKTAARLEARR